MPGRDPGGCIITNLLGVAGAFVGGFLYRLATGTKVLYVGFDLGSFAIAVLGAMVILAIYRLIARTCFRDPTAAYPIYSRVSLLGRRADTTMAKGQRRETVSG